MSEFDTIKNLVYDRFETEWQTTNARTEPWMTENDATDPVDADFNPTGGAWLRLIVTEETRSQVSLGGTGSRKFESTGRILVQCFVEFDSGTELLDTMLKIVKAIFEGVTFSGIHCFTALPRRLEEPEPGRWHGKIMDIEYRYEETK